MWTWTYLGSCFLVSETHQRQHSYSKEVFGSVSVSGLTYVTSLIVEMSEKYHKLHKQSSLIV